MASWRVKRHYINAENIEIPYNTGKIDKKAQLSSDFINKKDSYITPLPASDEIYFVNTIEVFCL